MNTHLSQSVARAVAEDRLRQARHRRAVVPERSRSPGAVRHSAALVAARVARRLDAEAARRVTAA